MNDGVERLLQDESVQEWLQSRLLINQARGMLMERFGIDADAAYSVLLRHSQHSNRKLREIARELVETRRLPGDPAGEQTDVG